jgi:hypothetical protein
MLKTMNNHITLKYYSYYFFIQSPSFFLGYLDCEFGCVEVVVANAT